MTDRPPPSKTPKKDFTAMFATSERTTKNAHQTKLTLSNQIRSTMVSIKQKTTVVNLNNNSEKTLETLELRDTNKQLTVKMSDTIKTRVVALGDKQKFVSLRHSAKNGAHTNKNAQLAKAMATKLPVEKLVTSINKNGLEIDVTKARAFCPLSQVNLQPMTDPAALVNQHLQFQITRYKKDRRNLNIIVSHRALLKKKTQTRTVKTRAKLVMDAVLPNVVTTLKNFSTFIDVDSIKNLLPTSEISFQRGTKPSDVLTIKQPITVQVLKVKKHNNTRHPKQVSFSLKSLKRDP